MNKYQIMHILNEKIPRSINKFELSLLLLNFKIDYNKANDFVKFKNLNNDLCLRLILYKFYDYPTKTQEYLKKRILNKINKKTLYKIFIMRTCNLLLEKNYDELEKILKSFIATGLVKNAVVSDDKDIIKITLPDNTEIKYSHIPLKKELLDAYKGQCHGVTSGFLKNCEKINGAAVVLEDNELFGKYYHSFLLADDIMHDLAHNIMMEYENYLKLINPTVLINEDKDMILANIKELENNNKSFTDSEYVDILKYSMSKQIKGK